MVLICLGSIVNYLSRNALGVLAPSLMADLHFTLQQYSYVVGAFQLAYTAMQPVCGMVLDLLGAKLGFLLFALAWSVASCLHGFAGGWVSLAVCRGLLGLSEAAAIPAGVKAISEWFPARERSIAVGLLNVGTSLGAMLAPPLVVLVQVRFGWSAAFVVTGALGFAFALLWWSCYRSPSRHRWLTEPERRMIQSSVAASAVQDGSAQRPSVRRILASRNFYGIAIPRFLAEPAWQTFNFWVPLYLSTERGLDIKHMAMFAWLPFLAADFGSVAGGVLSPLFLKYGKLRLVNSRLAGIVLGAICMIAPGCVGLVASAPAAIALLCVGAFAHQIISSLLNTLTTDLFPFAEVATANGLTGTAGWTGGLSFSLIVGALAGTIGFSPLFACLSLFDLIGASVAVLLLRQRHAAEPPGV